MMKKDVLFFHIYCILTDLYLSPIFYDEKFYYNIFETCLNIDRSGNETHCRVLSHYYCPNTWKYISEHRLLDGKFDCYSEYYNESCQLSKSTYRFQCQSEKKCISWTNVLLIVMIQEMKLCF
jgi:hypothetical protein